MYLSASIHFSANSQFRLKTLQAPFVGTFTCLTIRDQPQAEVSIIAHDPAKLAELRDAIHDYLVSLQPAEAA